MSLFRRTPEQNPADQQLNSVAQHDDEALQAHLTGDEIKLLSRLGYMADEPDTTRTAEDITLLKARAVDIKERQHADTLYTIKTIAVLTSGALAVGLFFHAINHSDEELTAAEDMARERTTYYFADLSDGEAYKQQFDSDEPFYAWGMIPHITSRPGETTLTSEAGASDPELDGFVPGPVAEASDHIFTNLRFLLFGNLLYTAKYEVTATDCLADTPYQFDSVTVSTSDNQTSIISTEFEDIGLQLTRTEAGHFIAADTPTEQIMEDYGCQNNPSQIELTRISNRADPSSSE